MLTAGIKLLKEHGYHGMSIKQLVDEIGVPKGSFYNYFPSKEEFVAAAIEQYGSDNSKLILEQSSEQSCIREEIITFFSALEMTLETDGSPSPCLVSALATEIAQISPLCREKLLDVTTMAKEHLSTLIRKGQEQHAIRADIASDKIAAMLYNNWHGQLLHYQLTGDKQALSQQITDLLDLIA